MRSKILFLTGLCLAFLSACNKEKMTEAELTSFEYIGEILGPDLALCACCGGHVITIEDSLLEYRITEFPSDFFSTLDELDYPTTVELNFTNTGECGGYLYIRVDDIEVIE